MNEQYYLIDVNAHLSKTVKVKASSFEAACAKTNEALKNNTITFDNADIVSKEVIGGNDLIDEVLDLFDDIDR